MGKVISKYFTSKNGVKSRNVTDIDKAILDLKNARDRLKRYQIKLDSETVVLVSQAQRLVKEGRKDRAVTVLKIKRLKVDQAAKVDSQLLTVDELIQNVEWESQQVQVIEALREGTKALNKLHTFMPIEEVEQLMDDTEEALEYEQNLSNLLAANWTAESDDDLLQEFNQLQLEIEKDMSVKGSNNVVAAVDELPADQRKELTEYTHESRLEETELSADALNVRSKNQIDVGKMNNSSVKEANDHIHVAVGRHVANFVPQLNAFTAADGMPNEPENYPQDDDLIAELENRLREREVEPDEVDFQNDLAARFPDVPTSEIAASKIAEDEKSQSTADRMLIAS